MALSVSIAQVRHEAPAGDSRVDLECGREDHILKRQARASGLLRRLPDAFAEFVQERLKLILFLSLCGVIGGPFLAIGFLRYLQSFSNNRLAVCCFLVLDRVLDSEDMFASFLPILIIGTGAIWLNRIRLDGVVTRAGVSRSP